jgi:NAD(P)-dependent dehydrogenase (short-subunit alcohol dehydrogenase family)
MAAAILITGASRGLGFEFVRQYVADGWRVFAACRSPAAATKLQRSAQDTEGMLKIVAMDVTDAMLCSPQSPRPGDGSTNSGLVALAPSPRSPSVRPRANGTSACSLPSPSYRPASLRRSSMAPRRRTSRSLASPRPCPIPGSSRSGESDCDVAPATNAGIVDRGGAFA